MHYIAAPAENDGTGGGASEEECLNGAKFQIKVCKRKKPGQSPLLLLLSFRSSSSSRWEREKGARESRDYLKNGQKILALSSGGKTLGSTATIGSRGRMHQTSNLVAIPSYKLSTTSGHVDMPKALQFRSIRCPQRSLTKSAMPPPSSVITSVIITGAGLLCGLALSAPVQCAGGRVRCCCCLCLTPPPPPPPSPVKSIRQSRVLAKERGNQ